MTETRRGELRAAPGRKLIGVVMKYGAEARVSLPDGRAVVERFAAFAFADYLRSGAETRVNLMHDPSITIATTAGARGRGNLALQDGPDALRMVATLPTGDAFDAALALVADGSTAETSVEFRAVADRIENGRRTVLQSTLPGIGIVDRAAYSAGAVEVRRRGGRVRARVPYNREVACECAGDCSFAVFEQGSFEIPDEVLAVAGEYKAPVASLQRGTLRLAADDEALTIEIDLPDPSENEATRRLLEASATVGVYARPYIDSRLSTYTEDGDTRNL